MLMSKNTRALDDQGFNEKINFFVTSAVKRFVHISKIYVLFNWFFLTLAVVEVFLFLLFFAHWGQTSFLAINLAVIFLTIFSYFVLRLYFKSQKPVQILQLRDKYISVCKDTAGYRKGDPASYLALAKALFKLVSRLLNQEYRFYRVPSKLEGVWEKLSCWWHWEDVHKMRELLFFSAIEEHIELIKCEPMNLEYHAALANAYVMLSNLYIDPRRNEGFESDRWVPAERYSEEMQQKFRQTAERAVEELKILNEYSPNDPWVHVQLAYNYHDLQMVEEEIHEYEEVIRLCPEDFDTLFKLGELYFRQGMNAKGLKAYETLKHSRHGKSENLIQFYGVYAPYDTYVEEEQNVE
jgi:tetratricopeptide (TPR) repeat protein